VLLDEVTAKAFDGESEALRGVDDALVGHGAKVGK
jgi:hypothetical protein